MSDVNQQIRTQTWIDFEFKQIALRFSFKHFVEQCYAVQKVKSELDFKAIIGLNMLQIALDCHYLSQTAEIYHRISTLYASVRKRKISRSGHYLVRG